MLAAACQTWAAWVVWAAWACNCLAPAQRPGADCAAHYTKARRPYGLRAFFMGANAGRQLAAALLPAGLHPPVNQHQGTNTAERQQLPPARPPNVMQAACAHGQRGQQQGQGSDAVEHLADQGGNHQHAELEQREPSELGAWRTARKPGVLREAAFDSRNKIHSELPLLNNRCSVTGYSRVAMIEGRCDKSSRLDTHSGHAVPPAPRIFKVRRYYFYSYQRLLH